MPFPYRLSLLAAALLTSSSIAAEPLKIVARPGDSIIYHAANPGKGYYDLMLQTLVLHNDDERTATLKSLTVDVLDTQGRSRLSQNIPVEQIVKQTQSFAGMAEQGLGVFLNAQLLNEQGLSGLFGDKAISLASSSELSTGEVSVLAGQYFATNFKPGSLRINIEYITATRETKSTGLTLTALPYISKMTYTSPLKGSWLMRSSPNIASHHRYIPSNEFAVDFFQTGMNGALDRGKKLSTQDDYGFKAPVHAVADGTVVYVAAGEEQDAAALSRMDGESVTEARKRITRYQMQRFAANFRTAAAGNMITLRHEADGQIEYSSYAHLAKDSVTLKVGDTVRQGAVIGAVGNTGDSSLTHLHFQINAGPEAFYSRSLPFTFSDMEPLYQGQDPGIFVRLGE